MPDHRSRFILLMGLTDEEMALSHFEKAGHRVVATPRPFGKGSDCLCHPETEIVFFEPSADESAEDEVKRIRSLRPDLAVVVVSPRSSAHLAIETWHAGAADLLCLPLTPGALDESLQRAERATVGRHSLQKTEPQARFRYLDDSGQECWCPISKTNFRIGRGPGNDLEFNDGKVSRDKVEVVVEDGEHVIIDKGSKHGTYLNGNLIHRAVLRHGDHIRLGGHHGKLLTYSRGDLLQSLLGGGSGPESSISAQGFRDIANLLSTLQALSSIPILNDLLCLVLDTAIELTGAERGFIMLQAEEDRLRFECARDAHKRTLSGSSFNISRRIPEEVFRTGHRVTIDDLKSDAGAVDHDYTCGLGVRSVSCVPLKYVPMRESFGDSGVAAQQNLGVLYLDSVNIGNRLSRTRIDALDALASEAAMAIYNARLYTMARAKQQLDVELAMARQIQQALLPPPDKRLPYVTATSLNLPCHEVGGDYYDYFDLEGGKLGFALGDVSGKGMPAALLASMLQGIFCVETVASLPTCSLIANVNRGMARRGAGNQYVTFFLGILDDGGRCNYVNAGHNPPLLVRTDGSMIELKEGGMVLGLFPQAQHKEGQVQLEPGDHLVLFTDGVLEARDRAGAEFGEQRLRDLLRLNARAASAEILHQLQQALASFSAGAPQHDDITLMVLGYREPPVGASGDANA